MSLSVSIHDKNDVAVVMYDEGGLDNTKYTVMTHTVCHTNILEPASDCDPFSL